MKPSCMQIFSQKERFFDLEGFKLSFFKMREFAGILMDATKQQDSS